MKLSQASKVYLNILSLSILSLCCISYSFGDEINIKNEFILRDAENKNSHVWKGACSISANCFGQFDYIPKAGEEHSTMIGYDTNFSFSDKLTGNIFYYSSAKTDPTSSEFGYDKILIEGKNYNTQILAVDNMPTIKKYITETYDSNLKEAIKKQLKAMYDKQPEVFKMHKEKVKQLLQQSIREKLGNNADTVLKKISEETWNTLAENTLLTSPTSRLSDQNIYNIFNKILHVSITEHSHVAGQVVELTKMTLNNSLWEPRRHSDVHTLETKDAKIGLNTKDEHLLSIKITKVAQVSSLLMMYKK